MRIPYDKLHADLRAAADAAEAVRKRDGGACNLDTLSLYLKGGRAARVEAAAKAAGLSASRLRPGLFLIWPPHTAQWGQGRRRTALAEAMGAVLGARGWDVHVRYEID